jgi:hypothetical protein
VPVFFGRLILVVDLTHACRSFIVVGLGGGVAGLLFVNCRQHVDPCFHLLSSSRVGWEDGSRPPLGASDFRHLTLASIASVPTFHCLRVLLVVLVTRSGDASELFPHLVPVVALGRLSCRSFALSPSRVACCLSMD